MFTRCMYRFLLVLAAAIAAQMPWIAACPEVSPFTAFALTPTPSDVEGLAVDGQGNLWLSDRSSGTVFVFNARGDLQRKVSGPGIGAGQLQDNGPLAISEEADLLAVTDTPLLLRLFSVKSGIYKYTLDDVLWKGPASGFFLSDDRIIYVGSGSKDTPPPPRGDFEPWSIFSTNFRGGDLRVERTSLIGSRERIANMLLNKGFSTPLSPGLWAVCKSLPRKVFLVNKEGAILRESQAIGTLPDWPADTLRHIDEQSQRIFMTAHVVGLISFNGLIGVLWQNPPGAGSQLSMEWMDRNLNPQGRLPLQLDRKLGPKDIVYGASNDRNGTLYILIVSRGKVVPGASTVLTARCK